ARPVAGALRSERRLDPAAAGAGGRERAPPGDGRAGARHAEPPAVGRAHDPGGRPHARPDRVRAGHRARRARRLRGWAHEHARDADDGHLLLLPGRRARHRELGRARAPPAAEQALMLKLLRQSIYVTALVPALPGIAIFVTSMAFNLPSDGLRDAMEIRA